MTSKAEKKMSLPMRLRRVSKRDRTKPSRASTRKAKGRENFGKEAAGTSIKLSDQKRWDSAATL